MVLSHKPLTRVAPLWVLAIAFLCTLSIGNSKEMYLGDFKVMNNFIFSNVDVKQTFLCRNLLIQTMSANTLSADFLIMDDIYAEEIVNEGSPYINLEGTLNIRGSLNWNPEPTAEGTPAAAATPAPTQGVQETPAVSFMKVGSLILNGVKQWTMVDHESFDHRDFSLLQIAIDKNVNGWHVRSNDEADREAIVVPKLSNVHSSNEDDKYRMALLTSHTNVIFKEFKNLPEHKSVMVEAQLILHAPVWAGEAVFVKVNKKLVWLDHYDSEETFDKCDTSEESWHRIPISFNFQHTGGKLLIEIGSNNSKKDTLSCGNSQIKHSIGLDDFVMYVK